MPLFDKKQQDTTYSSLIRSINRFSTQALSHPEAHRGILIDGAVSISMALLQATQHVNPRSLSLEGQQQLALGDIYYEHTTKNGVFLRDVEIPSHVAAAQTDERVALVKLTKGTRLIQYVRPEGYIGDYYSASDKITPQELGVSNQVSDPKDPTIAIDRVKLEMVVVDTHGYQARVSTAKPVSDFWSIKGKTVECTGGGEQHYAPVPIPVRQQGLVIIAPDDEDKRVAVEAIAKINGMKVMSENEIKETHGIKYLVEAYSRKEVFDDVNLQKEDFHSLQRMAHDALQFGHYQMAATYINYALAKRGVAKQDKVALSCVLGFVYAAIGQTGRATKLIHDYLSYDGSANSHLTLHAKLHLARLEADPKKAIIAYENLIATHPEIDSRLRSLLNLEIGIRYNNIASKHSDELTFEDFDADGKQDEKKKEPALKAEEFIKKALSGGNLETQEQLVCNIELALSLHKQRRNIDALKVLIQVEDQLSKFIDQVRDDFSKSALHDLNMQLLGVRLGIGLNLARCVDTSNVPDELKNINPVVYLQALSEELEKSPPMKVKLIFSRWIGPNANNLFIEGWFLKRATPTDASSQGSRLIALYRKFIPLDIAKICQELEANRIDRLDLAYLGMPEPAGISDKDFEKLCASLAKNTSLKALFIRKFSNEAPKDKTSDAAATFQYRSKLLFESLSAAHDKGQRLEYLSYSGARYNNKDEMLTTVNYLKKNSSLKILQASLYDWKHTDVFEKFADVIRQHPSLTTLLTGIFKHKGAGELLYHAGKESPHLRYIHPFPGNIAADPNDTGRVNNEYMQKLEKELHDKYTASFSSLIHCVIQ